MLRYERIHLTRTCIFFDLVLGVFEKLRVSVTGYKRQRTLANLSQKEVESALQEMRDTLGRKVPRHNAISRGVVERKKLSVQGVWRNLPDPNIELPCAVERRQKIRETMRFQDLVDSVGLAGVVDVMQTLLHKQEETRQKEIAKLPTPITIWPTE